MYGQINNENSGLNKKKDGAAKSAALPGERPAFARSADRSDGPSAMAGILPGTLFAATSTAGRDEGCWAETRAPPTLECELMQLELNMAMRLGAKPRLYLASTRPGSSCCLRRQPKDPSRGYTADIAVHILHRRADDGFERAFHPAVRFSRRFNVVAVPKRARKVLSLLSRHCPLG